MYSILYPLSIPTDGSARIRCSATSVSVRLACLNHIPLLSLRLPLNSTHPPPSSPRWPSSDAGWTVEYLLIILRRLVQTHFSE